MDLTEHFQIIAQNWWRILLAAALVAVGVYFVSTRRPKVYEASAQLSVVPGQFSQIPASQDTAVFLADTYAQTATTKPVIQRAIKDGKLNISVSTATSDVSASPSSTVGFMTITGKGSSPEAASRLANAVAAALVASVKQQQAQNLADDLQPLQSQITQVNNALNQLPASDPGRSALLDQYTALLQATVTREAQPTDRVELIAAATPPSSPSSPTPTRDAAFGFLIALVVIAELTVLIRAVGDRLPRTRDREAIARLFELPVLVSVPSGGENDQRVVEAFRYLRTSLNAAFHDGSLPRTIAVISASAGSGKSFTAINLARSAAAQQPSVVLVDADLRRPVIHERLGFRRRPGLTDILMGRPSRAAVHAVPLSEGYAVDEARRLSVIASGSPVPDPVMLLNDEVIQPTVEAVRDHPTWVVFDTPPVLLFADAIALASQCDAAIFVIDTTRVGCAAARNALSLLRNSGTNVIGLVLNRDQSVRRSRYYDAYRAPGQTGKGKEPEVKDPVNYQAPVEAGQRKEQELN